ncbi:DUF803-domain-containing protein [Rozella allomycis CSF55]|uniref:DUF803-domain-containing protein n=1 Tax=Rozella allomycis (strain CSF55) TaxID=988480 RepID=A0A075ANT5_ROZAC|nr:Magnesium transporter NIPA domain-containing protein [Rozella allomycis CSF55]RKP21861.1 DUF803-domain-containing protein [Rozella allomycis CSF55]|eukprot:EPZ31587.1 Magnesium transporter NIPA domain-containing protein [Rozella allomycis CSF55]
MLYEAYYMSYNEAQEEMESVRNELEMKDTTNMLTKIEGGEKPPQNTMFRDAASLFMEVFTLTIMAEWGDRSQITTFAMAASQLLSLEDFCLYSLLSLFESDKNKSQISLMEDKYIGLILAVSSSFFIGVSFIITKKGLISSDGNGDGFAYLRSRMWWIGLLTSKCMDFLAQVVFGELANFAAYTFAPAILVTPLGGLSVLISSLLATTFLHERLDKAGRVGCVLCLLGAVIIILHAPEEKQVSSIQEIIEAAFKPGLYFHMSSKALGISLKLTFEGKNQFLFVSTYIILITVGVFILIQITYLNKALDIFSTSVVTPIYYVFFTTATILASVLLFEGFNERDPVKVLSIFCGFFVTFCGVYLLNMNQSMESQQRLSFPSSTGQPAYLHLMNNNDDV